jgi:hypothetical protein
MRRLLVAALAIGLSACSSDSSEPVDVTGTYNLVLVGGSALPATIQITTSGGDPRLGGGSYDIVTITGGKIILKSDMTVTGEWQVQYTHSDDDGSTDSTAVSPYHGTYTKNGSQVNFSFADGVPGASGSVKNATVTMFDPKRDYTFTKANAL